MRALIVTLIFVLTLSTGAAAAGLPKDAFGKFGGEMPAYSVMVDGNELSIDKHDVFITIGDSAIVYEGGSLALQGPYTVFKQSKNEYVIKASLTNGKNLKYDLNLIWNKRENKLFITAKNGQAEAVLERMDS